MHNATHKEEGTHRRQLDTTDQAIIANELSKHLIFWQHTIPHYATF